MGKKTSDSKSKGQNASSGQTPKIPQAQGGDKTPTPEEIERIIKESINDIKKDPFRFLDFVLTLDNTSFSNKVDSIASLIDALEVSISNEVEACIIYIH